MSEARDHRDLATQAEPAQIQALSDWIIDQGLSGADLPSLIQGLGDRLRSLGLPLWRFHVSVRTVDPRFEGFGSTWLRDQGTGSEQYAHGNESLDRWQQSPLRAMIEQAWPHMRRRLVGPEAQLDYPILKEFCDEGGTDWYARTVFFGTEGSPIALDGMAVTLVSDNPKGFSDRDIAIVDRLTPRLGLAINRIALQEIATGVLDAYVGKDAGRRILGGQVQRGAVVRLSAAILFADLRGFTQLADSVPADQLIAALNDYLGSLTDIIESHGGEVLKFLGDGLLAVFDLEGRPPVTLCHDALGTAREGLAMNAALNERRQSEGASTMTLDIALHLGTVMYGNVGSDRRLDFTIIGPCVNEASRIEALCDRLGEPLLISGRFAEACEMPLRSLGKHRLRGVSEPQELFTLPS